MTDNPSKIESAIRRLAAEGRQGGEGHPAVEDIAAYHLDELPRDRREGLQDHLALCPDCTRLLLDLASFTAAEEEEAEPRGRVLDFKPTPPPVPVAYRTAIAALLVATLGLGAWVAMLYRAPRPAGVPRLLYTDAELLPAGEEGLRDAAGASLVVAPATPFELRLQWGESRPFTGYRVEIRSGGEVVARDEAPRRSSYGDLTLFVPPDSLAAGSYEISLVGLGEDGEEVLATYFLDLAYEPRAP